MEVALSALREQRRQSDAQYRRSNLTDLSQAEQKAPAESASMSKVCLIR
ncbi:MAG TPA: hypothetical protein VF502_00710 [Stellaceae bacterium]